MSIPSSKSPEYSDILDSRTSIITRVFAVVTVVDVIVVDVVHAVHVNEFPLRASSFEFEIQKRGAENLVFKSDPTLRSERMSLFIL